MTETKKPCIGFMHGNHLFTLYNSWQEAVTFPFQQLNVLDDVEMAFVGQDGPKLHRNPGETTANFVHRAVSFFKEHQPKGPAMVTDELVEKAEALLIQRGLCQPDEPIPTLQATLRHMILLVWGSDRAVPPELVTEAEYLLAHRGSKPLREVLRAIVALGYRASEDTPEPEIPEPEWVVNDLAELGVKIGNRFFWLYKGGSLVYKDPYHEDGNQGPMHWRPVGKREFGTVCHPEGLVSASFYRSLPGEGWRVLPPMKKERQ